MMAFSPATRKSSVPDHTVTIMVDHGMVGQMESGGGGSLPVRHPTLFLLPWVRLYGLPLSC